MLVYGGVTTGHVPILFFPISNRLKISRGIFLMNNSADREARKSQSSFPDHRGLNKPRGQMASHELMRTDGFLVAGCREWLQSREDFRMSDKNTYVSHICM